MRRTLLKLALPILGIALSLAASTAAYADWDWDTSTKELSTTVSTLVSIERTRCADGTVAAWAKNELTFSIVNANAYTAEAVSAIRAGISEWNNVGAPYKFREVSGAADVSVQLLDALTDGHLGGADVQCVSGREGIRSASIVIAVKDQKTMSLRNVAAHEAGHALGLEHANHSADLMYAYLNKKIDVNAPICPSNLDIKALSGKSDLLMPASLLIVPTSC